MKWNVYYLPSKRCRKPRRTTVEATSDLEAILIGSGELLERFEKPVVLNVFRAWPPCPSLE